MLAIHDDPQTIAEFALADLAEEIEFSRRIRGGFGPDGPSAAQNNPRRETFTPNTGDGQ